MARHSKARRKWNKAQAKKRREEAVANGTVEGTLFYDISKGITLIFNKGVWVPVDNPNQAEPKEGLWKKAKELFKKFEVSPIRKASF